VKAMFNNLINGFNKALSRITSGGLIREKDLDVIFEELQNTLLESDVHLSAIEEFLTYVKKEAVGKEIHKALTPKQQITKIINNSLINILGSKNIELNLKNKPSVIMLVGLQGAGKTTTTVKLAKYLKEKKNKNPIVVGVDFNRPAALEQ
jgi:signal recognition particle subunit SRP54